jgi:NTP pyrophosphatase (non-canonical NTP hydrolase)
MDYSINSLLEKCEEVSSTYASRNRFVRTQDWFLFKLQEEIGELTKSYVNYKGLGRITEKTQEQLKQDLSDELADVLGHVLLFAKHNDIDLEKALQDKWLKYLGRSPHVED